MEDHKVTRGRGVDKYPVGNNSKENPNLYENLKPVPIVDVYDGALFAAISIGAHKLLERIGAYKLLERIIKRKKS